MTSTPTNYQFMAPGLRVLSDGETRRVRDLCNAAADELDVIENDRVELIPSGQPRYLIVAMGYGGTQGKATRTQLSTGGGIVGRPEIQAFVGVLVKQTVQIVEIDEDAGMPGTLEATRRPGSEFAPPATNSRSTHASPPVLATGS